MQRIQGCQTCRHEQLCAVWNQSLHNTGEDIQKTRGTARSNLIAACNCSHDFSDGKNGNRVVGGAKVGGRNQGGDGALCLTPCFHTFR